MESRGSSDVFDYAKKLGILTIPNLEHDKQVLNLKKAIIYLFDTTFPLFFDHVVSFCKNGSKEILCFEHDDSNKDSKILAYEKFEQLKKLKLDESYKKQIVDDFISFMTLKKEVQGKISDPKSETLTIAELYEKYPSPYLDWLPLINSWLLKDLKQTLDDKILIKRPDLFEELFKIFEGLEET